MSYLRNTQNGRIVGDLLDDSQEYEFLKGLKVVSNANGDPNPAPLFEEVSIATLEHYIAGDFQMNEAEVPDLSSTGYQTLFKIVDSLTAAQDLTEQLGTVFSGGNVTSVEYFPNANVTGVATNTRTLSVTDNGSMGAAGSPTTVASLALVAGANLTGEADNAIPLSAAAVVDGDVLEYKSTHSGTGLADPGGLVIVTVNGYTFPANEDYSNAGYTDPYEGGE